IRPLPDRHRHLGRGTTESGVVRDGGRVAPERPHRHLPLYGVRLPGTVRPPGVRAPGGPAVKCHACGLPPTGACKACGRFYCGLHGGLVMGGPLCSEHQRAHLGQFGCLAFLTALAALVAVGLGGMSLANFAGLAAFVGVVWLFTVGPLPWAWWWDGPDGGAGN